MDREVIYLACEMAAKAGYNPHQLVIDVDPERDYDFLAIKCAPVDIEKIKPVFMKFYDEAKKTFYKEKHEEMSHG